jgi:hypothetical protein
MILNIDKRYDEACRMVWSKRAGGWCKPVPQHLKLPSEQPAQRFRVGGAGGFQ